MSRNRPPRGTWYESDNPSRHAWGFFRTGFGMTVLVVLALAVCGGIGWGIKVAVSDVKGAGDTTIEVNSATNRINAQEYFPAQMGVIKGADAKLDGLYALWQANLGRPDEIWHQTNYTGTQNLCLQFVATYDAEAQKITRAKWVGDMPTQIDKSDPATDCRAAKDKEETPR